jgi:hypothetical protein
MVEAIRIVLKHGLEHKVVNFDSIVRQEFAESEIDASLVCEFPHLATFFCHDSSCSNLFKNASPPVQDELFKSCSPTALLKILAESMNSLFLVRAASCFTHELAGVYAAQHQLVTPSAALLAQLDWVSAGLCYPVPEVRAHSRDLITSLFPDAPSTELLSAFRTALAQTDYLLETLEFVCTFHVILSDVRVKLILINRLLLTQFPEHRQVYRIALSFSAVAFDHWRGDLATLASRGAPSNRLCRSFLH